ncbi:MAG: TIGR04255 family protein [Deltaproteobacteria bacterium]|nr:TIGR04255 family protein [Deltaproteobacteria bacterium]
MTTAALSVPPVEPREFERNFIRLAVCELRFPTLLELETESPVAFQKALRKEYPHYESNLDVQFEVGGNAVSQRRHLLRSKDKRWTIALRPFALTIETFTYSNFEDLLSRLEFVLKSASSLLDTDFFTRIGLRYINALPVKDDDPSDWLNPALVSSLKTGVFGRPSRYWHETRGSAKSGFYSFRHGFQGIVDPAQPPTPGTGATDYLLDFDLYAEGVEFKDVIGTVKTFHSEGYALFSWSLGSKAREYLGTGARKRK